MSGAYKGLSFFTFPKEEERQAHFIEFARKETSSILLSDNVNTGSSVDVASPTASYVYS